MRDDGGAMAFLDTTPTSLVIEHLTSAQRRRSLDPTAVHRITVDGLGYVVELVPSPRRERELGEQVADEEAGVDGGADASAG
jgi:hypothetical protein